MCFLTLVANISNERDSLYSVNKLNKVDELPDEKKILLVQRLNEITSQAFGKNVPLQETWERTVNVKSIYLLIHNSTIAGYATNDLSEFSGKKVNYFSSGFIGNEFRGKGLYNFINYWRLVDEESDIIMTRTQNPLVVSGFKSLCDNNGFTFHPGEIKERNNALKIAKNYFPEINSEFICKNAYGRALMDKTPAPEKNTSHILRNIDVCKGDAVILLGYK